MRAGPLGLGELAPFLGLGLTVASNSGTPTIAPCTTPSLTKPSASFQFVIDALRLPTSQQNFASDINGDGRPDNVFANMIIALESQGFNLQGSIDTELQAAPPIVLFTLATEFATPASDQRARLRQPTYLLFLGQTLVGGRACSACWH